MVKSPFLCSFLWPANLVDWEDVSSNLLSAPLRLWCWLILGIRTARSWRILTSLNRVAEALFALLDCSFLDPSSKIYALRLRRVLKLKIQVESLLSYKTGFWVLSARSSRSLPWLSTLSFKMPYRREHQYLVDRLVRRPRLWSHMSARKQLHRQVSRIHHRHRCTWPGTIFRYGCRYKPQPVLHINGFRHTGPTQHC